MKVLDKVKGPLDRLVGLRCVWMANYSIWKRETGQHSAALGQELRLWVGLHVRIEGTLAKKNHIYIYNSNSNPKRSSSHTHTYLHRPVGRRLLLLCFSASLLLCFPCLPSQLTNGVWHISLCNLQHQSI